MTVHHDRERVYNQPTTNKRKSSMVAALLALLLPAAARPEAAASLLPPYLAKAPPGPPFDLATIFRTPTCVNYLTVTNALKYLTHQGLRKVFAIVPAKWTRDVSRWDPRVVAVDERFAVPGVSKSLIRDLLAKYGFEKSGKFNASELGAGRTSAGWYMVQFINHGFVLRKDVLDTVVIHDADQIILPDYRVYGKGYFTDSEGIRRPTFKVKVGGNDGILAQPYEYAWKCLTGQTLEQEPPGAKGRGSYISHSYTVFRPYIRELLSRLAAGPATVKGFPAADAITGAAPLGEMVAPWLESAIRCINPKQPDLGYSEVSNYLDHVVSRHRESVDVDSSRTWDRNPTNEQEWSMVRGEDGYCCNLTGVLSAHAERGKEYMGMELGHSYAGGKHDCNYATTNASNSFFTQLPYPPPGSAFWQTYNVRFTSNHL